MLAKLLPGAALGLALLLPDLRPGLGLPPLDAVAHRRDSLGPFGLYDALLALGPLHPNALLALWTFHPHALLALGTLHPDSLLALGTLGPDSLLALGTLGPDSFLALGTLGPDSLLALRTLGPDPLLALRTLSPNSLLALGTLGANSLFALRTSLLGLGLAGFGFLGALGVAVAASLGLSRGSDCKRRNRGDQESPGHR